MSAEIIDGEAVAKKMQDELKSEVEELKKKGAPVCLAAVQANDNPGSRIYVKRQKASCEGVGIDYRLVELPPDSSRETIASEIEKLNADESVNGVILQMPVPPGVEARGLQMSIAPEKDVEGMTTANLGKVIYGETYMSPCTALGAFLLAKGLSMPPSYDPLPDFAKRMVEAGKTTSSLYGKSVTVVGHSEIVGKPLALLFLDHFCTVTVCHIGTPPEKLGECCRNADILCAATGVPQVRWSAYRKAKKAGEKPPLPDLSFIKAGMIRRGAAVVDIAINRVPKGFDEKGEPLKTKKGKTAMRTVGDVDFEAAKEVAGWITPVPGGVGPMTTTILLRNTVNAAKALAEAV